MIKDGKNYIYLRYENYGIYIAKYNGLIQAFQGLRDIIGLAESVVEMNRMCSFRTKATVNPRLWHNS